MELRVTRRRCCHTVCVTPPPPLPPSLLRADNLQIRRPPRRSVPRYPSTFLAVLKKHEEELESGSGFGQTFYIQSSMSAQ